MKSASLGGSYDELNAHKKYPVNYVFNLDKNYIQKHRTVLIKS